MLGLLRISLLFFGPMGWLALIALEFQDKMNRIEDNQRKLLAERDQ